MTLVVIYLYVMYNYLLTHQGMTSRSTIKSVRERGGKGVDEKSCHVGK